MSIRRIRAIRDAYMIIHTKANREEAKIAKETRRRFKFVYPSRFSSRSSLLRGEIFLRGPLNATGLYDSSCHCEERSDEAISRKVFSSASRGIASPRKSTGARNDTVSFCVARLSATGFSGGGCQKYFKWVIDSQVIFAYNGYIPGNRGR